jgi:serine/threonine-protein kinase
MGQTGNQRLRATRAQFSAEFFAYVGDHDAAFDCVVTAFDSGLADHLWLQRCPMLDPLRERPRFRELAEVVAVRARRVADALAAEP